MYASAPLIGVLINIVFKLLYINEGRLPLTHHELTLISSNNFLLLPNPMNQATPLPHAPLLPLDNALSHPFPHSAPTTPTLSSSKELATLHDLTQYCYILSGTHELHSHAFTVRASKLHQSFENLAVLNLSMSDSITVYSE